MFSAESLSNDGRVTRALLLLLLLGLLLLPTSGVSEAQVKQFYWDRFDVDVEVLENGDLLVSEYQTIVFSGAPFTFGFRGIPTGRAGNNDGISDVTVIEGDRVYESSLQRDPYTYVVERSGDETVIRWYFPPATGRQNYTVRYRVENAVRTEEDGDQVFWNALPGDLGAAVEKSRINIYLPDGIEAAATAARWGGQENEDAIRTVVGDDGQRVSFELLQARPTGTAVEVGARFPSGQLQLETPSWQRAEQLADAFNLFLIVGSLLLVFGGLIGVLIVWYLAGRDPEIGPVPEYLSEPPEDVPPAVAGTLIDETAHIHDVMSTLIDLARRGYLTMTETMRNKDYTFTRTDKPLEGLRPFEVKMIKGIFRGQEERDLDSLRYKFSNRLPEIRSELYDELKQRNFVRRSPEGVRSTYGCIAWAGGALAFVSFLFLPGIVGDEVSAAICPAIALGVVAAAMLLASRFMPRKTEKGAEAAAKWLAFKRYLEDIENQTDLEHAADIFERYLPYAVAFGLERSWIRKFSAVPGTPIPPWYLPYPHYGGVPHTRGGRHTRAGETGGGLGESRMPTLEGMSGGLTGGLESMSSGLTRMLTNTQTVLQSTRSSSSGGSSGGSFSGGFSGGSSGGGSGGFG
ncbi:MAG: DUF2207 domain-containing protein [Candidatus Promineifilaceae bacterium]|nr:DUF2207 domain-containing protein [Candidatus Promineifilaceae bacterium]